MMSGDELYGDDVTSGVDQFPNQPGLIDEGGRQRVSDSFLEVMVNCAEHHAEECRCSITGDVVLPEVVVEDHEGFLVVADVAP